MRILKKVDLGRTLQHLMLEGSGQHEYIKVSIVNV